MNQLIAIENPDITTSKTSRFCDKTAHEQPVSSKQIVNGARVERIKRIVHFDGIPNFKKVLCRGQNVLSVHNGRYLLN